MTGPNAVGGHAELALQLPHVAAARLDHGGDGLVRAAAWMAVTPATVAPLTATSAATERLQAGSLTPGAAAAASRCARACERLHPELLAGKILLHFDMTSLSVDACGELTGSR